MNRLDANPEWAIVVLFVVSAFLSAIAFWQATRFADFSTDLANQARFAAAQQSRAQSGFQATVLHDRQVLLGCVSSLRSRDAALAEFSQSFDDAALSAVVRAEQTRIALQSLLIADASDCDAYDVDRALEFERFSGQERLGGGDWQALLARSERFSDGESLALASAVMFAIVLLLLTLADSTQRPALVRRWLALAVLVGIGAAVTAGAAFAVAGDLPVSALALFIGFLVLLVISARAFAVESSGWARRAAEARVSRRVQALVEPMTGRLHRRVRWWAQIFGAVTLVVFALAAFGFSHASNLERQVSVEADRLTVEAGQALELGQQSAIAVLDYVARLAELDAQLAADGQFSTGSLVAAREARQTVLDSWESEIATLDDLLDAIRTGADGAGGATGGGTDEPVAGRGAVSSECLEGDDIFVWTQSPAEDGEPLPAVVMADIRTDPDALFQLIDRGGTAALRCSASAAMTLQLGEQWGERASLFTVSLVILGLAGFLFALAADPDRLPRPRRWLLLAGFVGLATGIGVAGVGTVSGPPLDRGRQIDTAGAAYAASAVASARGDCAAARDAAERAVAARPDFGPAHAVRADAWSCTERGNWLLDPHMGGDALVEYRASLEEAVAAGMSDSATVGNLAWSHLLTGLREENRSGSADLRAAAALTEEALADDPANPFFCFNLALAALAAGDEDLATERYEAALAALEAQDPVAGPCAPVNFEDETLRNFMRIAALADLELITGIDAQPFRDLIVTGESRAAATGKLLAVTVSMYPQEIGLEGALPTEPYSIVWYYRSSPDERWALFTDASLATLTPAVHAGLWRVDRPLPEGQYRADVYDADGLVRRELTSDTWWSSRDLDPDDFRRVQAPDLGVSAVVPESWELVAHEPGVEVVFGSDDGSVAFRRVEGTTATEMDPALLEWAQPLLESWGVEEDLADQTAQDANWYLNLPQTLVRREQAGVWAAVGHQQYLAPDDKPGAIFTAEQIEHESCPGTTLMTAIQSDDVGVADTVWWSQAILAAPNAATVEEIGLQGTFASPSFALEIPDDWEAAACPDSFVGFHRDGAAFAVLQSFEFTGSLDELTASVASELVTDDNAVGDEVTLQNDAPAVVFGADSANRVLAAVSGERAYILVLTALDATAAVDADLDLIVDSFVPGAAEHVISAECPGCASDETRERQAALDEIARRLAAVDSANCSDATSADASASLRAVVACAFPGGFTVEYTLWATMDDMEAFADEAAALPEAVLQDWDLYPDEEGQTGITVEWVADDDARFFWTYDDLLLSGDATLVGGDQERLNDWWRTTGALVRE